MVVEQRTSASGEVQGGSGRGERHPTKSLMMRKELYSAYIRICIAYIGVCA